MSTPKSLHTVLIEEQKKIHNELYSRLWALEETKLADEVQYFSNRMSSNGITETIPENAKGINVETANDLAVRVDIATQYLQLSKQADALVRPILLYYSFANITGALSNSYFSWNKYRRIHGLKIDNAKDVWKTKITIKNNGSFPRLVITLFLLTGNPTPFDSLVTYQAKPVLHTGPGEALENFGKVEIGNPIKEITLAEIAKFDFETHDNNVKSTFGLHKGTGVCETAFLNDGLLLFVACSLARYRPLEWRNVLDGRLNDARLIFEDAFERYADFGFDRILSLMSNPLKVNQNGIGWNSHYYNNPYSESMILSRISRAHS
jgi:hypothetical protein